MISENLFGRPPVPLTDPRWDANPWPALRTGGGVDESAIRETFHRVAEGGCEFRVMKPKGLFRFEHPVRLTPDQACEHFLAEQERAVLVDDPTGGMAGGIHRLDDLREFDFQYGGGLGLATPEQLEVAEAIDRIGNLHDFCRVHSPLDRLTKGEAFLLLERRDLRVQTRDYDWDRRDPAWDQLDAPELLAFDFLLTGGSEKSAPDLPVLRNLRNADAAGLTEDPMRDYLSWKLGKPVEWAEKDPLSTMSPAEAARRMVGEAAPEPAGSVQVVGDRLIVGEVELPRQGVHA